MSKPTITRIFLGSLVAIITGLVVGTIGLLLAFANGTFTMAGEQVTSVSFTPLGWAMIGLAIVGLLVIIGGAIGQFIAWIGALLNTSRLEDKAWFIALLLLGIFSFGFIGMLVYVLAGPDGTLIEQRRERETGREAEAAG